MTDEMPIRPEDLRRMAAQLEAKLPTSRVARIYRASAERIADLEDAIDKSDAERDLAISYGRDAHAAAVLKEIEKRRGKDWSGGKTLRQTTESGRGRPGSRKRRGKTVTAKTRRKAAAWYYVGMPLRHRIDGKAIPVGPMLTVCGLYVEAAIISTNKDHCGRCARARAAEGT